MKPKRMTEAEIERIVGAAIDDAQSFIQHEIEDERNKAQRYFNGEVDITADEGRSKVVATKCRDVVRKVKPSLMRLFMSSENPAEFVPRDEREADAAEQATNHVGWLLDRNGKYRLLHDAIHDALIKKTGVLKAWYDESEDIEIDEFSGLTDDQFAMIVSDDDVEVLEHEAREDVVRYDGPEGPVEVPVTLHDGKVSKTKKDGRICVKSIPPEDFFVDAQATCLDDAYICGHRSEMRKGDLIEMGYEWSDVEDLGSDDDTLDDEADHERRGYSEEHDSASSDPSMMPVAVYEAYMRMDVEGTGIPRMYSFILGGAQKKLLSYELCDQVPFAVFEVDPEPHAFFGRSLVEILLYDQDVMTALWRGLIDNMAMSNNPGYAYDDSNVETDDMLNNEIGRLVRTTGNPAQHIMPLTVPFSAGQTIPAMEYYDQLMEEKTGVSRASAGLDPDSLQNTTATAVAAANGAAQEQMEMMARNLAEGGLAQLCKLLLNLTRQHVDAEEVIRVNGQFVQIDPRSWKSDMDVTCNVGLGTGGKQERGMALRETLQNQMQIWANYGPGNGLVTMTGIRNTLADLMRDAGHHNVDRYWEPMDEQKEKFLTEQAARAASEQAQQQDPSQGLAMAENVKGQYRLQEKAMDLSAKQQQQMTENRFRLAEMMREDDLARDEMAQKRILEAADLLGKYGIQIDQNAIRREQATNQAQMRPQGNTGQQ